MVNLTQVRLRKLETLSSEPGRTHLSWEQNQITRKRSGNLGGWKGFRGELNLAPSDIPVKTAQAVIVTSKRFWMYSQLQVLRFETGVFRKARQHLWSNFIFVMKGEDDIRPPWTGKNFVRAGFTFDRPTDAQESSQNAPSLG